MAAWHHPQLLLAFFTRFVCLGCLGERGYPSRPRSFGDKYVLPIFMLRPVRCADCYQRSIRPFTVSLSRRRGSLKAA
jgi:hypothetical protein